MKRSDVERRLAEFEAICREQRLSLTVQRREILKELLQRGDHPTADQVHDAVRRRVAGLSRTTVYRVLDRLAALGLIRRVHHPAASVRFDGRTDRHHHLVCSLCQRLFDIEDSAVDRLTPPRTGLRGFEIRDYAVLFLGTCAACRNNDRE